MTILGDIQKRKGIVKAAVYARYSSDMQREESIEAQLRAIAEFAKKNQIEIIGTYIDRAKSATTTQRPQFLRMIDAAEDQNFDLVLVHKLDRFARNRYDSIIFRAKLKLMNVQLLSVVENLDGSPESLILESVLEGMNEYYSRNLAREIEKGKTENAYKGRHNGGIPPLGYDVDHITGMLVINDLESSQVKYIFENIANRISYRQILNECERRGWKSKIGRDMTNSSLFSILRNEKYTGVYIYNKSAPKSCDGKRNGHLYKLASDIIRLEGVIPPIIDKELFLRVQNQLERRRANSGEGKAKRFYLLSGMLYCSYCGAAMVGNTRIQQGNHPQYSSYRCGSRQKGITCLCKEIKKETVERQVLCALADNLFVEHNTDKIIEEYQKHLKMQNTSFHSEKKTLQKQIAIVEKEINNLIKALESGESTSVLKRINQLEAQQADLTIQLQTVIEGANICISKNEISDKIIRAREQLRDGSLSSIKRIVNDLVSRVVVSNDCIDIFLAFWQIKSFQSTQRNHHDNNEVHKNLDVFGVAPSPPQYYSMCRKKDDR